MLIETSFHKQDLFGILNNCYTYRGLLGTRVRRLLGREHLECAGVDTQAGFCSQEHCQSPEGHSWWGRSAGVGSWPSCSPRSLLTWDSLSPSYREPMEAPLELWLLTWNMKNTHCSFILVPTKHRGHTNMFSMVVCHSGRYNISNMVTFKFCLFGFYLVLFCFWTRKAFLHAQTLTASDHIAHLIESNYTSTISEGKKNAKEGGLEK